MSINGRIRALVMKEVEKCFPFLNKFNKQGSRTECFQTSEISEQKDKRKKSITASHNKHIKRLAIILH